MTPGPAAAPPAAQDGQNADRLPAGWFSPSALRLHATMVFGLAICAGATWLERSRALGGHEIAWVYCVEWPLFGLMGIYVWWRLLRAELGEKLRPGAAEPAADAQATGPGRTDPGLVAWQAYLDRLHAIDPPGGPPGERPD